MYAMPFKVHVDRVIGQDNQLAKSFVYSPQWDGELREGLSSERYGVTSVAQYARPEIVK
jgi:hypothetical protein